MRRRSTSMPKGHPAPCHPGFPVRALERKRYRDRDALRPPRRTKKALIPPKLQAAWEGHEKDEIQQVIAALKQALPTASIEETGERATIALWRRRDAARPRARTLENRELRLSMIRPVVGHAAQGVLR